ncbi:MAG: DUF2336 domain-containing protein [Rickettsiales bacterium]
MFADSLRHVDKDTTEMEIIPPDADEDGSYLILKDRYDAPDGSHTDIEVRSDGIRLQTGDEETQVIPLTEDQFSLDDIDEDIRYQIARKISLLVPALSERKQHQLMRYVFRVLNLLAQDQLARVRAMIAEELQESYDAPPELVRRLAWDEELEVSAPVLEFSPLLNDTDLEEIIAQCEIPGVLDAIANRHSVSEDVTDAIVRNVSQSRILPEDARVINTLLTNQGAHFREDTLELVIDEAPRHEIWHQSLIDRPELTTRTINKIAQFVSRAMIMEMEERGMITEELGKNLKMAMASRLQNPNIDWERQADTQATDLFTQGELTGEAIIEALEAGEREFVISGITVLADVPKAVTQKIFASKDPKAVVALGWKAGLNMRDTIPLQLKLAKIHYTDILYAKEGKNYPLSEHEMEKTIKKYLKKAA